MCLILLVNSVQQLEIYLVHKGGFRVIACKQVRAIGDKAFEVHMVYCAYLS